MTYLIGIHQLGVNAILCDTRVTWWRSSKRMRGANVGLKSGLLFPGCVYGISGDVALAREFIIQCKHYLTGRNSLAGFWDKFLEFVKQYNFQCEKDKAFWLLLSSRNLGEPRFYILNSMEAALKVQGELVTIGSGKGPLDAYVYKLVAERSKMINEVVDKFKIPKFSFPYFYCLWLNEMTEGMELSKLEENDVGGIFHFLWQDAEREEVQHPAVYVLSSADVASKTIYSWIYRVTFVEGALVVDNPIINAREILIETAARPSFEMDTYLDSAEVGNRINSGADSQPFYFFAVLASQTRDIEANLVSVSQTKANL